MNCWLQINSTTVTFKIQVQLHVRIALEWNPKEVDLFLQTHNGTSTDADMAYHDDNKATNSCTCSREFCNCSIKAQVVRYVNDATIDQ